MNTNMTGFGCFQTCLHSCAWERVASALKGLKRTERICNDLLINDNKDAVFKMHILMWLSLLVQYTLGYFSFLY